MSAFHRAVVLGAAGTLLTAPLLLGSGPVHAQEGDPPGPCDGLPTHAELTDALRAAVVEDNGGLANDMWATIVNRDGIVCAVTFSSESGENGDGDRGDQWPGSRVISAQKANTANAFSLPPGAGGPVLPGLALSTANLWTAVQPGGSTFVNGSQPPPGPPSRPFPGGSLFGLQFSNPVDTGVAYLGPPDAFGRENDPMVTHAIGGVNVFGGGLALYTGDVDDTPLDLLGAVGVSGDTSCADHNVAWRVRDALGLDFVPAGVGTPADNIIFDVLDTGRGNAVSLSGFGHPECDGGAVDANEAVIEACPPGNGATVGCVADNNESGG